MKKYIALGLLSTLLVGCGSTSTMGTKEEVYSQFYSERPITILIMPPINRSTKVEAKELFYTSLCQPLAEKGYYILPPILCMDLLKEESAYDAEMFVNASMKRAGDLFGADAVLFTTIHSWSKVALAASINVKIEYQLKSCKTDEILFSRIADLTLNQYNSGNGLAGLLVGMISTALTKEIIVGRQCNGASLNDIPLGKYATNYDKDRLLQAQPQEIELIISQ